jgi:hypothetical protein
MTRDEALSDIDRRVVGLEFNQFVADTQLVWTAACNSLKALAALCEQKLDRLRPR